MNVGIPGEDREPAAPQRYGAGRVAKWLLAAVGAALAYADRILHMAHGATFLGTPEAYRQSPLGMAFAGGEAHA